MLYCATQYLYLAANVDLSCLKTVVLCLNIFWQYRSFVSNHGTAGNVICNAGVIGGTTNYELLTHPGPQLVAIYEEAVHERNIYFCFVVVQYVKSPPRYPGNLTRSAVRIQRNVMTGLTYCIYAVHAQPF